MKPMKTSVCLILLMSLESICEAQIQDVQWPQFRGINCSGVAAETADPPIIFDSTTVFWRKELPKGVSSPVIWNDNLIVTGFNESNNELSTLCLDRKNGNILWTRAIRPDTVENSHAISSPAQSTVVTDGERIITYFGSCGLFCYDMQGQVLWKYPLPCSNTIFGNGTSPAIAGDKLLLIRDFGSNPYLLALDKKTGSLVWKTHFKNSSPIGDVGQSVPCLINNVIVVHRAREVSGFSVKDGSLLWNFPILTSGVSSPIIAGDKVIAACWYNLSEEDQRGKLPGFDELIKYYDKNQNGSISSSELPEDLVIYQRPEIKDVANTAGTVKDFFGIFDRDDDGEIVRQEWDAGLALLKERLYKPAGLIALNPADTGDLLDTSVLWRVVDNLPEVPSPIFYKNRVYMVKDGGIITCVDPANGKVIYTMPIGNRGGYIASPIAANGFLYIFNYNGKLKILKAGDNFAVAGEYDFKDKIAATPAIIGNTIYIRTGKELIAYSKK